MDHLGLKERFGAQHIPGVPAHTLHCVSHVLEITLSPRHAGGAAARRALGALQPHGRVQGACTEREHDPGQQQRAAATGTHAVAHLYFSMAVVQGGTNGKATERPGKLQRAAAAIAHAVALHHGTNRSATLVVAASLLHNSVN